MTAIQDMPQVHDCSASDCSFNSDASCHAGAITIGGEHAHCGTFVTLDVRPVATVVGKVGACHRIDCVHNDKLACGAPEVSVGANDDLADCLTFMAR